MESLLIIFNQNYIETELSSLYFLQQTIFHNGFRYTFFSKYIQRMKLLIKIIIKIIYFLTNGYFSCISH